MTQDSMIKTKRIKCETCDSSHVMTWGRGVGGWSGLVGWYYSRSYLGDDEARATRLARRICPDMVGHIRRMQ